MVINTHGQLLAKENSNEGVLFKLPDNCKVCYIGNLNRSLYFQTNLIERFKDLIHDGKGFLKSDFGKSSHDESELTADGEIYRKVLEKVNNICLIKSLLSKHSKPNDVKKFKEKYHTIFCQEYHETIDDALYHSFLLDFKHTFRELMLEYPNEFPEDLTIYVAKGEKGKSIKFPDFLLNFDSEGKNCRSLGCNFTIIDTNDKTLPKYISGTTFKFKDIMYIIEEIKKKFSIFNKKRRVPDKTPKTSLRLSELIKTFSINNSKYNTIAGHTFKCKTFYVFCCKGFDGNIHKLSTYCQLSRAIQLQKHDTNPIVQERVSDFFTDMKNLEKILYSRSPMSSSEQQESRSYDVNYSSRKIKKPNTQDYKANGIIKKKKIKTNKQKFNFKKHITQRLKPRIKIRSKPKKNKPKLNKTKKN
jgi:hypothetical protein